LEIIGKGREREREREREKRASAYPLALTALSISLTVRAFAIYFYRRIKSSPHGLTPVFSPERNRYKSGGIVNRVEKLGQFPEGKKLERGSRGIPTDPRTEYDKRRTVGVGGGRI